MHRNFMILRLVLVLLAVGLGWLFVVQNADAMAGLGLYLGFAAWRFGEPQPVALLVLGSFSLGLLLGVVRAAIASSVRSQRENRLERERSITPSVALDESETEDAWD
ncbi:MAG: hypothetical protein VX519_11980 [Myxococcota bacterium]|nr:hypothetical protein [Myxococcota bacterium]